MSSRLILPLSLIAAAIVLCLVVFMVVGTTPSEAPAGEISSDLEVDPPPPPRDLPDFPADPSTGGNLGLGAEFGSRNQDGLPSSEALAAAMAADTSADAQAKEAVLSVIDDASVTYDVEGLKVLGPLLGHADPEVRAATIEGIIQLGETAGAKTLREAARRAKEPREAAEMIRAAKFLELPEYQPGRKQP